MTLHPTLTMVIVSACTITFSLLLVGEERAEEGGFGDCGFGCVGDFLDLVGDVMTFNVDGAPWWVRVPVSIIMVVPWAVLIVETVARFLPG